MTVELVMVGTPDAPGTLRSALACRLLVTCSIPFDTCDASEPATAASARERSGYDLFPQVFIGGEFIGGTEMLVELIKTGALGSGRCSDAG